jgi:hypothetical protein
MIKIILINIETLIKKDNRIEYNIEEAEKTFRNTEI